MKQSAEDDLQRSAVTTYGAAARGIKKGYVTVIASTPPARDDVTPLSAPSYVCASKTLPFVSSTAEIRELLSYWKETVVKSGLVTVANRPWAS
jgi:hypothetical protein